MELPAAPLPAVFAQGLMHLHPHLPASSPPSSSLSFFVQAELPAASSSSPFSRVTGFHSSTMCASPVCTAWHSRRAQHGLGIASQPATEPPAVDTTVPAAVPAVPASCLCLEQGNLSASSAILAVMPPQEQYQEQYREQYQEQYHCSRLAPVPPAEGACRPGGPP